MIHATSIEENRNYNDVVDNVSKKGKAKPYRHSSQTSADVTTTYAIT